jgi:hypothetical protein
MAGLSAFTELLLTDVGASDTRTDIKQARRLMLAQESAAVCRGGG